MKGGCYVFHLCKNVYYQHNSKKLQTNWDEIWHVVWVIQIHSLINFQNWTLFNINSC